MTTSEDPVSQVSSEPAGPNQPRDGLEDWLSDLRTEGSVEPPGQAAEEDPPPPQRRPADTPEPGRAGRHRAAD
jgi:hypothetical protein